MSDVNIVLDICQPRPAFVTLALQALSQCQRKGDRLWLYVGSVQTLEYNLVKGLIDEARLQGQVLPRPEAHRRARQLLKTFAADKQWLAALAGEGDVFDSDDPEDEQLIRALARFGGDARLLSRDGLLAERYPDRVISPEAYLALDRPPRSLEFIDLKTQQDGIRPALERNLHRVLHHGQYILGPEIAELETALAEYVGVKHCLTVASGTDSLEIALRALGIGPGDEVLTVPFTWISSAEIIGLVGATPVFVDIEPESFNIDVAKIEAAITSRTKAILPVSLFGQMPDYATINAIAARHGLTVIEDAAQSFGATQHGRRSCGVTTIASTSFFPAKPLGCYGDGGALFTDDDKLAERMRAIRTHGGIRRHHHPLLGMNGRFDTLQAAVLLAKDLAENNFPGLCLRTKVICWIMTRIWRRKAGGSWWATRRHWNSRCSACLRRSRKRIGGAMRRLRRPNWVTVALAIWPSYSTSIQRPCGGVCGNWNTPTIRWASGSGNPVGAAPARWNTVRSWKTTFCGYWPNSRRGIRCGKGCCGRISPVAKSAAVCGRWGPRRADIRFVSS